MAFDVAEGIRSTSLNGLSGRYGEVRERKP